MSANEYTPGLLARIEQAIAWGRSFDWMTEKLGVSDEDIDAAMRRMDAAIADDEPTFLAVTRREVPVDPDEARVLAYMAGDLAAEGPKFRIDPNRVEAIRRLAAEGYIDVEIARLLGSSKSAVEKMRQRNGIERGSVARRRSPSWASLTRAEPRARRVRAEREAVA